MKLIRLIDHIKQALPSTISGVIMKTVHLLLVAAVAATASLAASGAPSSTDEARAEAAQRTTAAAHAALLQPYEAMDSDAEQVSDTDSARRAAGQLNARHNRDRHLTEVLRAAAGIHSAPIAVTDTDSARAAAGQKGHEQALRTDHVKL